MNRYIDPQGVGVCKVWALKLETGPGVDFRAYDSGTAIAGVGGSKSLGLQTPKPGRERFHTPSSQKTDL